MAEKIEIAIGEKPLEEVNGDDAFYQQNGDGYFISLFDGAGHGKSAHSIASTTRSFLKQSYQTDLPALMEKLHSNLRSTNGGVAIIANLDLNSLRFDYVGIGNIFMCKVGKEVQRFICQQGVLGYQIRTPVKNTVQLVPGEILILYSDGIMSNFDPKDYPNIYTDNAETIAQNITRKFAKASDDATCLVIRVN
ncbi:PP2C family protein-serine/threonine phosphatase [Vibrio hepatarius]|uniref:PP2C family protein-serine/threonine phosphatase n=1 Tax=Vibrio hepatarius TaxID=171383 RepID=UPI001C0A5FD0|nr:SpoIIE family protein phosphatase [Vibrio hepatarius]MBU2896671.1 SpoIIE family protein phosphatase [Vibrio hepatarius]